jgi:hypothetical protein
MGQGQGHNVTTTTATNVSLASAVEVSKNDKTGKVSATYTGYQTCSDHCPLKPTIGSLGEFKQAECYASCDLVGMTMHRLTTASVSAPLVQIQAQECDGIRKLSGKRPLRLKVGGDTPNTAYAEALSNACDAYTAKHDQPTYGYTHTWREIPRESFGTISMLASCDAPGDIAAAKQRGYATAIVVSEFPQGNKLFTIDGNKCIPCPEQCSTEEKHVQCIDCKLCFRDGMLRERGLTIAFNAHGRKSEALKATLQGKGL